VSDGHYTYEERAIAKESVEKAIANGVAVLWIQMQGGYNAAQEYLKNTSVQIVVIDTAQPATEWAGVIGKAGADALTKIGRKLG
jgi:predicted CoA-binding protein